MALWHLGDNFTADIVVLAGDTDETPQVLLIRRKHPPFQGDWALPGGFLNSLTPPGQTFVAAETPEEAAARELHEETNIICQPGDLKLIGIYDAWGRDPRAEGNQQVITHAFMLRLKQRPSTQAGDDAAEARWFLLTDTLSPAFQLAFEHREMLLAAQQLF